MSHTINYAKKIPIWNKGDNFIVQFASKKEYAREDMYPYTLNKE